MAEAIKKKKMSLGTKSLIGVAAGLIVGAILVQFPAGIIRDDILVGGIFQFIGKAYLTLLKMTIIPFVFCSLIVGMSSATDVKQVGRVGSKILLLYATFEVVASAFGIAGGIILQPGAGVDMGTLTLAPTATNAKATSVSFVNVLLNMLPSNIFESLAKGNMIHVVLFASFVGIVISLIGEKAKYFKDFVDSTYEIMTKIVDIVMQLTPIGVFCLMSRTVVTAGYAIILALGKYALCEIFLFILFGIIIYIPLLKIGAKVNPIYYLRKFSQMMVIPFSTSSSNISIPYSLKLCDVLGVSKKISSFTIPLGATINMDGSAIMQGMTAMFVAQLYGVDLTWSMIITIVITATLGTIGSPGMPGVVMVTLLTVLTSVGFPLDAVAIIVGIDRFTDMFKTVLNVMGDSVCTCVVSRTENALDDNIYTDMSQKVDF
ncbi:dicarboxylate/amino acid:cation symporter [Megasphaera sp.]|uniref:dicarboxylate/amino acid:cation symporter n=1 Tax=Megasphaera sp. TaxID=2023260 RepID=UPI003AAC0A03